MSTTNQPIHIESLHRSGFDQSIVDIAERVGRDELGPRARAMDEGREPPHQNFAALARAGLLGLNVPPSAGGLGAGPDTILRVTESLARHCAVTAFVLVQHTGVCGSIAVGNAPIAAELLPRLARGEYVAAIGASQLRRAGPPMLRAVKVPGGYRIDGTAPWVSGYGLMTHVSLGAVVDSVGPLFFWTPFTPTDALAVSEPQDLTVMRAASTVVVRCEGLFVPDGHVIGDDKGGYWQAQHGGALANPTAFVLGIGSACVEGLRNAVVRSGRPAQIAHAHDLEERLQEAREAFYGLVRSSNGQPYDETLDALLALRIATSRLVLRIADTWIAAEGGSAHLRSNPAQRRLREAAFFLTVTVNASAREALVLGI